MRHNLRLLIALNTDPYLKSLCVCCSLNPPTCLEQKELTERERCDDTSTSLLLWTEGVCCSAGGFDVP